MDEKRSQGRDEGVNVPSLSSSTSLSPSVEPVPRHVSPPSLQPTAVYEADQTRNENSQDHHTAKPGSEQLRDDSEHMRHNILQLKESNEQVTHNNLQNNEQVCQDIARPSILKCQTSRVPSTDNAKKSTVQFDNTVSMALYNTSVTPAPELYESESDENVNMKFPPKRKSFHSWPTESKFRTPATFYSLTNMSRAAMSTNVEDSTFLDRIKASLLELHLRRGNTEDEDLSRFVNFLLNTIAEGLQAGRHQGAENQPLHTAMEDASQEKALTARFRDISEMPVNMLMKKQQEGVKRPKSAPTADNSAATDHPPCGPAAGTSAATENLPKGPAAGTSTPTELSSLGPAACASAPTEDLSDGPAAGTSAPTEHLPDSLTARTSAPSEHLPNGLTARTSPIEHLPDGTTSGTYRQVVPSQSDGIWYNHNINLTSHESGQLDIPLEKQSSTSLQTESSILTEYSDLASTGVDSETSNDSGTSAATENLSDSLTAGTSAPTEHLSDGLTAGSSPVEHLADGLPAGTSPIEHLPDGPTAEYRQVVPSQSDGIWYNHNINLTSHESGQFDIPLEKQSSTSLQAESSTLSDYSDLASTGVDSETSNDSSMADVSSGDLQEPSQNSSSKAVEPALHTKSAPGFKSFDPDAIIPGFSSLPNIHACGVSIEVDNSAFWERVKQALLYMPREEIFGEEMQDEDVLDYIRFLLQTVARVMDNNANHDQGVNSNQVHITLPGYNFRYDQEAGSSGHNLFQGSEYNDAADVTDAVSYASTPGNAMLHGNLDGYFASSESSVVVERIPNDDWSFHSIDMNSDDSEISAQDESAHSIHTLLQSIKSHSDEDDTGFSMDSKYLAAFGSDMYRSTSDEFEIFASSHDTVVSRTANEVDHVTDATQPAKDKKSKHKQQATKDNEVDIQDLPSYSTPSKLFRRCENREKNEAVGKDLPDYTTPSKLLRKCNNREKNDAQARESLPDYTTPSVLLQKVEEREAAEQKQDNVKNFPTPHQERILHAERPVPSLDAERKTVDDGQTWTEYEKGQGVCNSTTVEQLLPGMAALQQVSNVTSPSSSHHGLAVQGFYNASEVPACNKEQTNSLHDLQSFTTLSEMLGKVENRKIAEAQASNSETDPRVVTSLTNLGQLLSAMCAVQQIMQNTEVSSSNHRLAEQQLWDLQRWHDFVSHCHSKINVDNNRTSRETQIIPVQPPKEHCDNAGKDERLNDLPSSTTPTQLLEKVKNREKAEQQWQSEHPPHQRHRQRGTDETITSHSNQTDNRNIWLQPGHPTETQLANRDASVLQLLSSMISLQSIVDNTPVDSHDHKKAAQELHNVQQLYTITRNSQSRLLQDEVWMSSKSEDSGGSICSSDLWSWPTSDSDDVPPRPHHKHHSHHHGTSHQRRHPPSEPHIPSVQHAIKPHASSHPHLYENSVHVVLRPATPTNSPTLSDNSQVNDSDVPSPAASAYGKDQAIDTRLEFSQNFKMEKELLESQLRKVQMENSRLQNENKILQEKYKRSNSRASYLEQQILQGPADKGALDNSDFTDTAQGHLAQEQVLKLKEQVENLKSKNAILQQEVNNARNNTYSYHQGQDFSSIVEGFNKESAALKVELSRLRELLEESERARQQEAGRVREMSAEMLRLTEMKALLQQQLQDSASVSVAEKQVKSLSERLHVTEDRLHHERANRASKLCDVEERLIKENARLLVSEKELQRQLNREKEKHRSVEARMKEYRDQVEKLQASMSDNSKLINNIKNIRSTIGTKKQKEELKAILEELKREENLGAGQENEIIWLLWQLREEQNKQLKEWEISLNALKVDHGSIGKGLKALQEEKDLYEERLERYRNMVDDLKNEKADQETTYKQHISELTDAKHKHLLKAQNLEDKVAALTAENEALKASLFSHPELQLPKNIAQNEVELLSVRNDLHCAESELSQQQRTVKLLQSRLDSAQTQLVAKDLALQAALKDLSSLGKDIQSEVQQTWSQKAKRDTVDRMHTEDIAKLENDFAKLENDLHDKESEIFTLTVAHREAGSQLTRAQERVAHEQENVTDLTKQLDQLQLDLQRKSRNLDHLNHADSDHSLTIRSLRENLTAINAELDQKNKELKMKDTNLEMERKKVRQLENDVRTRDGLLSENITQALNEGKLKSHLVNGKPDLNYEDMSTIDARTRLLEYERNSAQADVKRAEESMTKIIAENADMLKRLRDLGQDLVKERAMVCQLTSDKVDAEQRLRICLEERDSAMRDKQRLESRLARHEATTMKTVQLLEEDHKQSATNFKQKYHSLDSEGKALTLELATAQRLLEAREKEIELLRTRIENQSQEIGGLQRQLTLAKEEHLVTKTEVESVNAQLSYKLKDEAASAGSMSSLVSEKLRLEMEKEQRQRDHERDRQDWQRQITELQDINRKLEKSEDNLRQSETIVHHRNTKIVGLEMELKHISHTCGTLEADKAGLKAETESLNAQIRALKNDNADLQQQLSDRHSSLTEEKFNSSHIKKELNTASQQVELVRQEYDLMTASLDHERKAAQILRDSLKAEEEKNFELENKVRNLSQEVKTLKSHLDENTKTIDQYKKDKQVLYQDVQDLCRKLSEKDDMIAELQERSNSTVENIHKDFSTEKSHIKQQLEKLAAEHSKTREELDDARDKLRHKELQLQAHVRTYRELEQETKGRHEAEKMLDKTEDELLQNKRLVTQLQAENKRLTDQNRHIQDMLEKTERNNGLLKEQLQQQREESGRERHEMKNSHSQDIHRLQSHNSDLQDQLSRAQLELKAAQASLASAVDAKKLLQGSSSDQERALEQLRSKLHEEVTSRKLADQKLETLIAQVAELKDQKKSLEGQLATSQNQITKLEGDCNLEKEKYRKMKHELTEAKSSSTSQESYLQSLHADLADLQAENGNLRSQLESVKHGLHGKNKRLALELKQQIETHDKERSKLIQQAQQLSVELDAARESAMHKARENLEQQEQQLTLESKLRDATTELRKATDSLKQEREQRDQLQQRNHALEMELLKYKPHWDGEPDNSSESARLEMNKMMSDLSKSMQQQVEAQKHAEKEARNKELKNLEDFKKKRITDASSGRECTLKHFSHRGGRSTVQSSPPYQAYQITQLESTLGQEQALHMITKTQLESVNDDNTRLRQQLQIARKKHQPPAADERAKNRMEEINEIISRSQSRAQQLLSSGNYSANNSVHEDDPLRIITASRDLGTYSNVPVMMMSPLNRSGFSDDLLNTSSPVGTTNFPR